MELKKFLDDNRLTQGDLARFLAVDRSTVSRMVSGQIRLSEEALERLKYNDQGWDVTSLLPPSEGRWGRSMPSWKERMYEDMIRERDEKILSLQERLYSLMYKKDEKR